MASMGLVLRALFLAISVNFAAIFGLASPATASLISYEIILRPSLPTQIA